jgi:type IV secretion system protein VirB11
MSFAGDHAGGSYLRAYLSHLDRFLTAPDVTDIFVNKPGEVWVERVGAAPERHAVPALDQRMLERLVRQVAAHVSQGIGRHAPLLAASLPGGARIQVVAPPATRGAVAIAIRKQAIRQMTLADCAKAGLFDQVATDPAGERAAANAALAALHARRNWPAFLTAAVRGRRNVVIAGGTATGKTTFLNALLQEIPDNERIVVIEDTPEVRLAQPNAVGLVAVPAEGDDPGVSVDALLRAALRMRPSRIVMGELRGAEAYSFLRAVNTGHPGSITTLHADSPALAVEQLALMVLQSGTTLSRADVIDYVRTSIDVFVQLANVGGKRYVSSIDYRTEMAGAAVPL